MPETPVELTESHGLWRAHHKGPGSATKLVNLLANHIPVRPGFRLISGVARPVSGPERRIEADQTNESWVVDEQVIVKWNTQPLVGPEPGPDRLRKLFAANFSHTPRLWGTLEWRSPEGHWVPVGTATEFISGAVDGWDWCVREARIALGLEPGTSTDFAEELGRITGEMHLALVSGQGLVAGHGDYHVGQVLRAADGRLMVVDFDGNPTMSPADRVAHRPAAFDVAQMVLSLENVGYVATKNDPQVPDADLATWTSTVTAQFLHGYRAVADQLLEADRLDRYVLDQIQRELTYATDYLPRWTYVPQAALRRRGLL